ncbi:hypothetical protein PC129_g12343 [Phytophthora cactorum]|uniref:RING-type domain-containing protein n=1 Tax=Phytophthora cactorum TaxID=29920 RepID=A0A329RMK9_9STRA|nr:hypothetical protein Pcac1_g16954 [Phytophthora cactorum]KAG2811494.1 hypothetical protein PC111_g15216 [Phytophthora cactorum]KAG2816166.1 hypothetical protein PC112_g13582 [Phytophthora cactorum]KAG2840177.1 hypothetical protein PC113_g19320 [Phytophthora cactorum]KAG2882190.1 hypothetical protein PC114_g21161 [Phytophthora cactorum]
MATNGNNVTSVAVASRVLDSNFGSRDTNSVICVEEKEEEEDILRRPVCHECVLVFYAGDDGGHAEPAPVRAFECNHPTILVPRSSMPRSQARVPESVLGSGNHMIGQPPVNSGSREDRNYISDRGEETENEGEEEGIDSTVDDTDSTRSFPRIPDQCRICFSAIRDHTWLECAHAFCDECISRWIEEDFSNEGCPICQTH